jgi:DNA mismatch repair protein MutS
VETTTGDSRDDADDADDGGDASEPATNGASARDSDAVADALNEHPVDAEAVAAVATQLRELDIATMTPIEALNTLDEFRSELDKK